MSFGTYVPGRKIKDFSIQGNFSHSYLAVDENLGRVVAVKDIINSRVNGNVFEAFINELRLLTSSNTNRIAKVLYAGMCTDSKEKYRIVSEYYENGSLQEEIDAAEKSNATLHMSRALEIVLYTCKALENLHKASVIHNDIKPSNILLDGARLPVITDFGQSAFLTTPFVDAPQTYWKNVSPEYLSSGKISLHTDVYQVGILIFRLLCSKIFDDHANSLFAQDKTRVKFTTAITTGNFPDIRSIPIFVPSKLITIIKKCLLPNPLERYENIYDLKQNLESVVVYPVSFNFATGILSGEINGYPVEIHIINLENGNFDIKVKRGTTWQHKHKAKNATTTQARKHVAEVLDKLARR